MKEKIQIRIVEEPAEKILIARKVLEALPEWFENPSARETYISESGDQIMAVAYDGEIPAGYICLKETGRDTAEIAVMGVRREYHHQGIGTKLFACAKQTASEKGCSFLQVKTVKMGIYEEYDITNRFYLSLGFREFEVIPDLWGEANPCQIYVMSI